MTSTGHDPNLLAAHAYLDGELDPVNAIEIERRFAAEPALAAERDRVTALRNLIQRLPRERAPAALVHRIETVLLPRTGPSWRALAAAALLAALVASATTWLALRSGAPDATPNMVVASHVRSLMAPQPTDVSSSDRHTVKPWFSGRIAQAPAVVDLTSVGFPLVGGRIDVIARTPVPTLVYRHRQHLISLTAISGNRASPSRLSVDGYNILSWSDAGVIYWAVSDLAAADLDAFAKAFQTAAREG
jgi:anti-sigma factor RsiW